MAAYAIGRLEMRDPSWLQDYGPKTAALVAKHGGKYLVRGGAMERKDIFLELLRRTPTLKTIADLGRLSPPLTFADTPVCAIDPPEGFEAVAFAMTERCPITIVYEHGWQRPQPRMITPRLVLEPHGVAYVIAHCHRSDAERTYRLDRIRECWLK